MNLWFLLGDPTQRNHGYDHVGSGTATIAVALVVERNPVAAPGILASAHLHVVRHHRSRPDGAEMRTVSCAITSRAIQNSTPSNSRPKNSPVGSRKFRRCSTPPIRTSRLSK